MKSAHVMGCLLISCLAGPAADQTHLKPDERIVFYPAIAQRIPGESGWRVEIRGCVFEPEKRRIMTAALREALNLKDVEMTPSEERIFNQRARLFLVDHERGKKIFARFSDQLFPAGRSAADGRFAGTLSLRDAASERRSPTRRDLQVGVQALACSGGTLKRELQRAGSETRTSFTAALPSDDARLFSGEVFFLEEEGLSVISDIDDTIKISEVRDRHAMLRNAFLRELAPVPGMAEFYQMLARSNHAQFHYVSASPWQLYEPLAEFVNAHGFPHGTFALKEFRWKNRNFLSLFSNPEKYKPTVIEPLLKRFPQRRFILIGDSGERDPEIYAALARKYPRQIVRIYIRDVTGESASAPRFAEAFRGLPGELWQVFTTPAELKPFDDPSPAQH
jgi:hypothetical protein